MNLIVEINAADDLPLNRKDVLDKTYQREFGQDPMVYDKARWFALGSLDGTLIGQVGILEREISVDGKLLAIGGIHGVVTEPKHRHRGVASTLIGQSVAFIKKKRHLPYGLLTCKPRLEAFYNKLGWKTVKGPCVFEQPSGPRSCGGLTMVIECASRAWPEGRIDLRGLPW